MEAAYWLAWSEVKGIGPVLLKRIFEYFGSLEVAWQATDRELVAIEGLGGHTIGSIIEQRPNLKPQKLWEQHLQTNPHLWTPADPNYPKLLWEIPDPPPMLYWQGNLQQWTESYTIGIVGTRNPTPYGLRWTEKITEALTDRGFVIISGMAEGIDTSAHQSCLKAKGKTIAVVGTGVDRVYPARNQKLYDRIVSEGLVLSEYPQGTPPDRSHFPKRNRIIAGLSRAILVMEAPEGSGALITAYQANEYHRDVFVLPGNIDTKQSKGCLQLIQRGAQMILGIEELLELLGAMPKLDSPSATPTQLLLAPTEQLAELNPIQITILQFIPVNEPVSFDRIVSLSGIGVGEISGHLLEMELMGIVIQHPGMRYQRA